MNSSFVSANDQPDDDVEKELPEPPAPAFIKNAQPISRFPLPVDWPNAGVIEAVPFVVEVETAPALTSE